MVKTLTILTATMAVLTTGTEGADLPPFCCLPDQWKVTQVHTYFNSFSGIYDYGEVVSNLAHDAVNQREVYCTTRTDNTGRPEHIDYYLFYQEDMMYVYFNKTDTCIKQNFTNPFYKRCVPGSAEVSPRFRYGRGRQKIRAARAKWSVPRKAGNLLFITLTVSPGKKDCIPILEKFKIFSNGTEAGLKTETAEFTNMKIGNLSEELFDLPPACSSAEFGTPERYPSIAADF